MVRLDIGVSDFGMAVSIDFWWSFNLWPSWEQLMGTFMVLSLDLFISFVAKLRAVEGDFVRSDVNYVQQFD